MRERSRARGVLIAAVPVTALASVVAQMSLAPWLQVRGGIPNFLVATTAAVALHFGPWAGIFWGGMAGLLADILAAHPVGLLALPLAVVGYAAGLGHRLVLESRVLAPVLIGLGTTWLEVLLQIPVALIWGYPVVTRAVVDRTLPASLYTALWTWIFFLLLLLVHRLQKQERLAL